MVAFEKDALRIRVNEHVEADQPLFCCAGYGRHAGVARDKLRETEYQPARYATGRRWHLDGGDIQITWRDDDHVLMAGPVAYVFDGVFDPRFIGANT